MPPLIAVAYVSSAARPFSSNELDALLVDAREFNAGMGVTGALLHQDGSFSQYFEGSESGVGQVYERIKGSRKHQGLIELVREPADQRHFSTWSMGFAESAGSELQAISQAGWHRQRQAASVQDKDSHSPGLRLLLSFWQRDLKRR